MTALAVGPANYAGQASAWAAAVQRTLGVPAWSFARTEGFAFPVDRRMPARGGALSRRVPVSDPAVAPAWSGATHVALDGFLALSGGQVAGRPGRDLAELAAAGVRPALVAHGSDVRDPLGHALRVRHSWFRTAGVPYLALGAAAVARNRAVLLGFDGPVYVSTPDLLHDVPRATWLPLTVDLAPWAGTTPAFTQDRLPRVLHLPSRRRPAIKGTDVIDPVLRGLAAEGLCDYLAPDHMPHAELVELIKDVDVVVDQVLCDSYGTTAVEAMAAGRLVVASVLGSRDLVDDEIPVVDATPADLDAVLRRVLTDRDGSAERAAQGPAYVTRHHDGRAAAEALRPWLGVPA
ncbi:glycosyltransferase [Arsenicicoccus dermatophilus]|uniref:glycosyltransferase n=1 Tax=Arsenicicoccus dermatophilus TaxID=1076331 RepID=UPI001F4D0D19|nr:glycosyltransferase [Arsenicicoccus dermatophilus]MCH8614103.1 glycosyltransferase [Arsenicicoccus dermatophilus]